MKRLRVLVIIGLMPFIVGCTVITKEEKEKSGYDLTGTIYNHLEDNYKKNKFVPIDPEDYKRFMKEYEHTPGTVRY